MAEVYNFAKQVELLASERATQLAVVERSDVERRLTYGDLCAQAAACQAALMSVGVRQGDRVFVLLGKGIDSYVVYLGLLRLGAVILPGSEMLRARDITYRIRHAQVTAVIAAPQVAEEVYLALQDDPKVLRITVGGSAVGFLQLDELTDLLMGEPAPPIALTKSDDMAFISYTSGTTGGQKGVVHSAGWPRAHLTNAAEHWFDVRPGEWAWATAGPGWAKWIWSPFVSILGKGGTAFVFAGKFDAVAYLEFMETYPISLLCSTPTEYRLMAKSSRINQWRPSALRSAVSAGEPLNREVIDTFYKYSGVYVRDGYGQTENSLLVSTHVGMLVKPGSMGKPSPGHEVTIIDEDGMPLPPGQVGDIALRRGAPTLFQEYLYDSERTDQAYRGDFYITGDQGRVDEDGYFWFEGRSDDIIISAGYTIGPFEVEDALVSHPVVAECAAVASPDPERGHIVKAFVILKDGLQGSPDLVTALQEHVKSVTAPYKYPREIEFVDQLPKTASGKIRRIELRALERIRHSSLPRK